MNTWSTPPCRLQLAPDYNFLSKTLWKKFTNIQWFGCFSIQLGSVTCKDISSCNCLFWSGLIKSNVFLTRVSFLLSTCIIQMDFSHWLKECQTVSGQAFLRIFKGNLELYKEEIFMSYKFLLFSLLVSYNVKKWRDRHWRQSYF